MAIKANMADHMAPGASGGGNQKVLQPIPAVAKLFAERIKLLGPDELKALVGLVTEDTSDALSKLLPELKPLIDKAKTMNPQDINTQGQPGGQSSGQSSGQQQQPQVGPQQ